MKKLILIALILTIGTTAIAHAGVGSIKMSPAWPVMLSSPADFQTWVEGNSVAYELHVLIAMTEDCYDALSGPVQVYSGGSPITISPFTAVSDNSEKVPSDTTASYTVASLKDHLSYGLSVPLSSAGTIYYCLSALPTNIIDEPLTGDHQTFTVEVPSSKPRALVYVMGSSVEFNPEPFDLDMRTPPTMPGFIVPEPATIAAVATSIGAFGLYAYYKKRKP